MKEIARFFLKNEKYANELCVRQQKRNYADQSIVCLFVCSNKCRQFFVCVVLSMPLLNCFKEIPTYLTVQCEPDRLIGWAPIL